MVSFVRAAGLGIELSLASPADNVVVNQLFGVASGLGMGLFSFDWSQIAFVASPLIVPWWAQLNIFGGFFVAFWIIAPIMYYTNVSLNDLGKWGKGIVLTPEGATIRRLIRPISRSRPRPSLIASDNRTMPCASSTLRVSRST